MLKRNVTLAEEKKKKNRGSTEIVAFVLLLIFILLLAAPKIKNLGQTVSDGVGSLNTNLSDTLNESK